MPTRGARHNTGNDTHIRQRRQANGPEIDNLSGLHARRLGRTAEPSERVTHGVLCGCDVGKRERAIGAGDCLLARRLVERDRNTGQRHTGRIIHKMTGERARGRHHRRLGVGGEIQRAQRQRCRKAIVHPGTVRQLMRAQQIDGRREARGVRNHRNERQQRRRRFKILAPAGPHYLPVEQIRRNLVNRGRQIELEHVALHGDQRLRAHEDRADITVRKPEAAISLLLLRQVVNGGADNISIRHPRHGQRFKRIRRIERGAGITQPIAKTTVRVLVRNERIDEHRNVVTRCRVYGDLAREEFGIGFGVAVEKPECGSEPGLALLTERLVSAQNFGSGLDGGGERGGGIAETAVGVLLGREPGRALGKTSKGGKRRHK